MKTTPKKPSPPLSDVLNEFALASESPRADLLDHFISRYPQYATELIGLAVELAVDAGVGEEDSG